MEKKIVTRRHGLASGRNAIRECLVVFALASGFARAGEEPFLSRPPDTLARQALERVRTRSSEPVEARWNSVTGRVRALEGRFHLPLVPAAAPEEDDGVPQACLHFISVEPQLFGWTPELELQLTSRRRGIGTEHVRFQALFSGVPISGSELAFHLDRPTAGSSQLHFLTARLYPDTASLRAEDLTPRFSSRQAIDTAEAAVNLRAALPQESKARLEILPVPPPGRLVYVVRVASRDPHGVFRVRVDARHGDVLSVGDVLRYGPQNPTDGSGQVFLSNPIVALKDKTLTDDDNSAEAVPLEAYSEVTLRDLDGLGGLTGPYVTTENTPRAVRRVSLLFSAG